MKEENREIKTTLRMVNFKLGAVDKLVDGNKSEQPTSSNQDTHIKVSEEQQHLNNERIESKC